MSSVSSYFITYSSMITLNLCTRKSMYTRLLNHFVSKLFLEENGSIGVDIVMAADILL